MAGETALYSALSGDTSITDVVSDRIYSDVRDQGDEIPAISFERYSTEFMHSINDYSPVAEKSSFTVTCSQTTRELSEALTSLIITATATSNFLCSDKQHSFDEDTGIYTTTIQLNYIEVI